jgi:hypothetical protein
MLDTVRTTIAPVTENLTDGQYLGFGVLFVLAVYVTVYLLVVKARRDDRIDEAAYGIARLHDTSPDEKLRLELHGRWRDEL